MRRVLPKILLPGFPRTPHLPGSRLGEGDFYADTAEAQRVLSGDRVLLEEKLDGANVGVRFDGQNELLVRNKDHVLNKGYLKKNTPAKVQFRALWSWVYDHRKLFQALIRALGEVPNVYGEWLYAQHTLRYIRLPAWFIPFDLMVGREFLDPFVVRDLVTEAGFQSPPKLVGPVEELAEEPAAWAQDVQREGVYVKVGDGRVTTHRFKFVRPGFHPCMDFNDRGLLRNKVLS